MAHYVKCETSFMKMFEGHCINKKIQWKFRKNNVKNDNVCEEWESDEEVKKERKESIKRVLKDMRSRLIQIEKILADDL